MKDWLEERFGVRRPVIGLVHFPPTPGQPLYDERGGLAKIRDSALRDAEALAAAGVDGFLFANEGDRPYRTEAPAATVATMAAMIPQVIREYPKPFGVAVLADPLAAMSIAAGVGATFIRGFLTWTYVSDWGLIIPKAPELLALRRHLDAGDVRILANLTGHSVPMERRSVGQLARGAAMVGLADALCLSGDTAGSPIAASDIEECRAATTLPVVIGSGASVENIGRLLPLADATLVGTSVKVDGSTFNPVDPARARKFMDEVRRVRERIATAGG